MVGKKRVRELSRVEVAILYYLLMRGIKQVKDISKALETDISYTYKILDSLEVRGFVVKMESKRGIEYMAKEGLEL